MNTPSQDAVEEEGEDGKSGSGDFGRPQLKPNLEALFDPAAFAQEEKGDGTQAGETQTFGAWEIQESSLTLFNKQKLKKLRLEELNAPSKLLKVVVGLATQNHGGQSWDIENLIKAMDAVAQSRFGKTLYQLASLSNDAARLDWRQGTLVQIEAPKNLTGFPLART